MSNRVATPNYQALAAEFAPGDVVVPYGANRDFAGRVVQVFPAIGMVDVEYSTGSKRYPVEELLRLDDNGNPDPPKDGYVPGGAGTVPVSGGPGLHKAATTDPHEVARQRAELAGSALSATIRVFNTEVMHLGSSAEAFATVAKALFGLRGQLINTLSGVFPGFNPSSRNIPRDGLPVVELLLEVQRAAERMMDRVDGMAAFTNEDVNMVPRKLRTILDAIILACREARIEAMSKRVASAFDKQALYWAAKDRQYRATSEEISSGHYGCPKCKKAQLRKAIYRRIKGQSEHLFGCPRCLFLIARESLIHPETS